MRPDDLPGPATHDDVRLSRRERRAIARLEADLVAGPVGRRSDPATLLALGLGVLVVGAIAASGPVVVLGIVLSLGTLLRAGVRS